MRQRTARGNAAGWRRTRLWVVVLAVFALPAVPASADAAYPDVVRAGAPVSYWRLGETSGTVAADQQAPSNPGTYLGGVGLGAPGALVGDPDRAAAFDGIDDEVRLDGA